MNEEQLKKLIMQTISEVVKESAPAADTGKAPAAEETTANTEKHPVSDRPSAAMPPVSAPDADAGQDVPDLSAVNFRQIIDVPNPANPV